MIGSSFTVKVNLVKAATHWLFLADEDPRSLTSV